MLEGKSTTAEKPVFVEKSIQGNNTYEVYEGSSAAAAREYLQSRKVDEPQYYLVVRTPEGNWGMDQLGLYLEHLLPWQTDPDNAEVDAEDLFTCPYTMTGVDPCSKGTTDNFIVKVRCGKCQRDWLDAVRYQDNTVVRCPDCGTYNRADTRQLYVV